MAVSSLINSLITILDAQIESMTPVTEFDNPRMDLLRLRAQILAANPSTGGGGGGGGSTDMTATNDRLGATNASSASSDTANASLNALLKRLLSVKLANALATAAGQDTINGSIGTGNGTLSSILDKIIAAPATEAKQDSLVTIDTAIRDRLPSTLSGDRMKVETSVDAALVSETALTAAGSTPARSMAGYSKLTYQVDVSSIGTNVVVRIEGNLQGSTYVNLNSDQLNTTITANGSYLFAFEGKITNVRFTTVSITGGTPSVTAHLLRGN